MLKQCLRCLEHQPLSEFHKHKGGRGGLNSQCKMCVKRPRRMISCRACGAQWPNATCGRPAKLCASCEVEYKVCFQCDVVKPHSDFHFSSVTRLGLMADCKQCRAKPRETQCRACGTAWTYCGGGILPKLCNECETTLKYCRTCRNAKPHSQFNLSRATKTGLNDDCRPCAQQYYRERGASLRRTRDLKNKYGITPDEWDAMLSQQGGRCASCRGDLGLKPAVDHCHQTMAIRGILCSNCNTGIGKLGDNPEGLQRAETYLWSTRNVLAELTAGQHTMDELALA